ncbi:hypothetical protein BJV77DRAFT_1085320 [Russula vinacea]|nr:hypothetical protein BJV77DRAFT_1085320 [Russula vinacea]
MYLIEGTFSDIAQFAGTTVEWIIRVAHLLCDPLGNVHVFTHTTGSLSDWYSSDRTPSWQEVSHGDQLLPGIYKIETTRPIVISQICEQDKILVTTTESAFNATTFHDHLIKHDTICAVSGSEAPLKASHLIPRCIGSDRARDIVEQFANVTEATGIHDYDPRIGIMLFKGVGYWVGHFQVGFYHIADTYTIHNFNTNYPRLMLLGSPPVPTSPELPELHGYQVTLSVHAGNHCLPPPGVFNWHYLQCIIK